jgi:hypothetical protein
MTKKAIATRHRRSRRNPFMSPQGSAVTLVPCRHPERSEGTRGTPPPHTARTFQPKRSILAAAYSFCLSSRRNLQSPLLVLVRHPERSEGPDALHRPHTARTFQPQRSILAAAYSFCLSSRMDLRLLLLVLVVILSEAKDPDALHRPIPLAPFSPDAPPRCCLFLLFVIPQGSAVALCSLSSS